jgi:nucleoside-diphosphate-sugar epimerase
MSRIAGSRVFVTGGAGHIGSHIVDQLLQAGPAQVVVYDNLCEGRESNLAHLAGDPRVMLVRDDIRDPEDLEPAMRGCEYVFHVASVLLLECRDHPVKAIEVNIRGTFNVLQAAVNTGVKKVVFSSTGSVYGEPVRVPMDEDHPYNSETIYGTTKIAGEHLLRDFHRAHGLEFVALRYFNVYGPRQHYKGAYAQIVPRWVDRLAAGEPLVIHGDGSQTMDMTYVSDIARANVLALESVVTNDFVNVGTGIATSVLEVANELQEIMGVQVPLSFVSQDVNLVKRRQCATEKAKRLLGYEAKVSAREGLRRYCEWRQTAKATTTV